MASRQARAQEMADWAARRGSAAEQAQAAQALAILDLGASIRFHGLVTGNVYDDELLEELLRKAGVND